MRTATTKIRVDSRAVDVAMDVDALARTQAPKPVLRSTLVSDHSSLQLRSILTVLCSSGDGGAIVLAHSLLFFFSLLVGRQ